MRREFERLFGDAYDQRLARDERYARLPVDVYSTEDKLIVTAAVPGISPDDVEVTFEGDVLTIKGDLPAPLGNVDYFAQERPYGAFQRAINVGVPVDADNIEATFDRGVLNIALPKAEEAKPKKIEIKVA
jgi:HSP20 family protein